MQQAKNRKRNMLIHAILAIIYAVGGAVGLAALTVSVGVNAGTAVLIALTAYGFYGIVFYWLGFVRASAAVRCILAVEDKGLLVYSDIAADIGMTVKATKAVIAQCIGRAYLTRYGIGKDSLVRV